MAPHATDFNGGDTEFGIVYPTGYVLAVFPDASAPTMRSRRCSPHDSRMRTSWSRPGRMCSSTPASCSEGRDCSRASRAVAQWVSDAASLVDELVALAGRDNTFVAVLAPGDAATAHAAAAVRTFAPVVLWKYGELGIISLR